jgi:hypothetical protein
MKTFILASCLFSQVAFAAVTVETTGKGITQEEAVRRAKLSAIEKVTGSFNLGQRTVRGNDYGEEIDDYVSGIILESTILDSQKIDSLWQVKLRATVDETKPSTFEVKRDKPLMDEASRNKIAEMQSRRQIADKFEVPGQAMVYKTDNVFVSPRHDVTVARIDGKISWQQKWINDFENFTKVAGNMNTARKTYQSSGLGIFNNPAMIVTSVLLQPAQYDVRPGHTYCFTEDRTVNVDRCHNLGYEIQAVPKYNTVRVRVTLKDSEGRVLKEYSTTRDEVKMAEFFVAGTSKKTDWILFNTNNYFKTNATVIRSDVAVPASFELTMPNELAMKVATYNIEIL